MQVLCKLLFYTTGVYDQLYSAVHPMKYLESDVMGYKICTCSLIDIYVRIRTDHLLLIMTDHLLLIRTDHLLLIMTDLLYTVV